MECPICKTSLPDGGVCPTCRPAVQDTPTTVLEKAAELRAAGQIREAMALYINIINAAVDAPETAPVYELLGDAFHEQNDIARALEAYRRAVKLKPTSSNRQKFDDMIDLSRGGGAKPASTASHGPSLAAGVQKSLAGVQKSLSGVQKSLAKPQQPDAEAQPPVAEADQLVIGGQQPDAAPQPLVMGGQQAVIGTQQFVIGTQQPVAGAQLPSMTAPPTDTEIPQPLDDTPLPVTNLPYTGTAPDGTSADQGSFMSLSQQSEIQARNRAYLLLGVAVLTITISALLSAQPWQHAPKPTPNITPITFVRIDVVPLPPALGSSSGTGFSLLSQKPKTVGKPVDLTVKK